MNWLATRGHRALAVLVFVAVTCWPAVAWAAAPPTPGLRRSIPAWLGLAVMFVLVAAILALSLMPSKRGHQD